MRISKNWFDKHEYCLKNYCHIAQQAIYVKEANETLIKATKRIKPGGMQSRDTIWQVIQWSKWLTEFYNLFNIKITFKP